ncbi:hypothetical protein MUK42_23518 [Musa troglodytarum]|uniref:Uncharacterized protein n=1 Tax=Musa troglodytarum TaxID=320322 RepID=A0A9E7GDY8_9LILI|nr:hypothetical protein MUK42_23518 [Musa troglodytarum]
MRGGSVSYPPKALISMAEGETNVESHPQTLKPESNPLPPSKRKPDSEALLEEESEQETKHQKLEVASDPAPPTPEAANEDDTKDKAEGEPADANGDRNAAVDKGKGVLTAVDKGKGIAVDEEGEEEEEGDGGDDKDSDDSSGVGSGDEIVGEEDDDSDFLDDPLAEVDLENILPSRTRRREPPPPGAYFDPDQDEDDSDDSEHGNSMRIIEYPQLDIVRLKHDYLSAKLEVGKDQVTILLTMQ